MTRTCGCGRTFTDDAAGRHAHKVIQGHAPTRPPSEEA